MLYCALSSGRYKCLYTMYFAIFFNRWWHCNSTDDDIVYCIQILTMSFINHNKEVIKLIQHLNQFNQKLKVIRTSFYLIKGCRWIIPLIQPPPKSKLFHSQKSINNLYLSLNKVHKATLIHLTRYYYDTTYWSLINLVKICLCSSVNRCRLTQGL